MRSEVRIRGTWPEPVQIRRGWALALARPWNDQSDEIAALRLERGGDGFLVACSDWLAEQGVRLTRSPALARAQTGVWKRAGFRDHLELVVFERTLRDPTPEPMWPVIELTDPDIPDLARIDDRAFDPTWRVGRGGLIDSIGATPTSVVLGVVEGGRPTGFAIVGEMSAVAYLQRLAVEPDRLRRGIGGSLVRAALRWAGRRGARTMLLNTQPENGAAAALYEKEGFVALASRLQVLARNVADG